MDVTVQSSPLQRPETIYLPDEIPSFSLFHDDNDDYNDDDNDKGKRKKTDLQSRRFSFRKATV